MRNVYSLITRLRFFSMRKKSISSDNELSTGAHGEQKAVEYLVKNGFSILERNFETPFGEIDIIASKKKHLYLVEVKTRLQKGIEDGRVNLTEDKLFHFFRSGLFYIKKYKHKYAYSFAALIITINPLSIRWYDNLTLDCDAERIIRGKKRGKL